MAGIIECVMLVIIGAFVFVVAFALLTLTEIITPKEVRGWLKGKKRKAVKVVRCKDCTRRGDPGECPMCFFCDGDFADYTNDDGYCDRGERDDDAL